MSKLTAKQRAFVREYLLLRNATQAAINAGYSEKTARAMGCENLTKPNIVRLIKAKEKKLDDAVEFGIKEWRQDLINIARADIGDFMDITPTSISLKDGINDMPPEKRRLIAEASENITQGGVGSQRLKLNDKNKAYDMLGKHLGAYEKDNDQQSSPTLVIEKLNGDVVKMGMGEDDDDI